MSNMSESQVTALIENEKEWRRHLVSEISSIKEEQKKITEEVHSTKTSITILNGKMGLVAALFSLIGSGIGAVAGVVVDRFMLR